MISNMHHLKYQYKNVPLRYHIFEELPPSNARDHYKLILAVLWRFTSTSTDFTFNILTL